MDVLIFIVALLIVGGILSAMHGFIKPAVDWVYPDQAAHTPPQDGQLPPIANCDASAVASNQKQAKRKSPDGAHAKWWEKEMRKRRIKTAVAAHESAKRATLAARPRLP